MLKGIDPWIGPELLGVLARMGHGDEIAFTDANFPSASVAQKTVIGHELRMDCDAVSALQKVLTLLPLDSYVVNPVTTMQVVGDPAAVPEVVSAAIPVLQAVGAGAPVMIERFEFYARAREAFAVVRTAETRSYGNFLLRKGVINP